MSNSFDTSKFDPKDPVHRDVWDHLVGDVQVAGSVAPSRYAGPVAAALDSKTSAAIVDAGFRAGDWVLDHGGQPLLDVAGFVPGLNVVTEGVQSGYHAIHAANDYQHGNRAEAEKQLAEATWHGGSAVANAFTLEGGNAVHAAYAGLTAKEAVHAAHTVVDASELAWDTSSTVVRNAGGSDEDLPFFGALVPWMAHGGGKEHVR